MIDSFEQDKLLFIVIYKVELLYYLSLSGRHFRALSPSVVIAVHVNMTKPKNIIVGHIDNTR